MKLKTVIIEDEERGLETLKALLDEYVSLAEVAGTAMNISEGYQLINEVKPDLVFLDIEMPGGTGFELLNKSFIHTFDVVFITAYSDYALKAIKFQPLGYLLKPVDRLELQEIVTVACKKRLSGVEKVLPSATARIALPTMQGIDFVEVSEIIKCTAKDNYTEVTLTTSRKYLISRCLAEFEDTLTPLGFLRVHNSSLVNPSFISSYNKSGFVTLTDGSMVEVAKRRKNLFNQKLLQYRI